jgi:hypothetical protein
MYLKPLIIKITTKIIIASITPINALLDPEKNSSIKNNKNEARINNLKYHLLKYTSNPIKMGNSKIVKAPRAFGSVNVALNLPEFTQCSRFPK